MSVNNGSLNIISWNAQSIANQSKISELSVLLKQQQIHIACIQETYLNNNSKVYIDGYIIYRNDRDTHGGGVAILVKKGIRHRATGIHNTGVIENLSIEVPLGHKNLIITSA